MAEILDGVALASQFRGRVAAGVREMQGKHGVTPGLAAVLVGDDPASAVYVRNKRRACDEVGMVSKSFHLPAESSTVEVVECVDRLNRDPRFHGILVQLPLPVQVDEQTVIETISPDKDVDSLHPQNVGKLVQGIRISFRAPRRESGRFWSIMATTRQASTSLSAGGAISWAALWRTC